MEVGSGIKAAFRILQGGETKSFSKKKITTRVREKKYDFQVIGFNNHHWEPLGIFKLK